MIKTIFSCFCYAALNVFGTALIKFKLKNTKLNHITDWVSFVFTSHVIVAFIFIFISALVMFKVLSTVSLSSAIPIATGLNFILTLVIGYYFFGDQLNLNSFIGFSLIFIGIIILSLNNQQYAK
jgi:multidrug transporter EmrE-like cation transporter